MQGIQDGFITITLVDGKGNMVGSSQNTPVTSNIGGNYAVFKCQVQFFLAVMVICSYAVRPVDV